MIDATRAKSRRTPRDFKNGTWFSFGRPQGLGRTALAVADALQGRHITRRGRLHPVYQNELTSRLPPVVSIASLDAVVRPHLEKSLCEAAHGIPETVEEASEKPRAGGKPPTPRQSVRAKRRIPDVV
jgi:hypothetical protein